MSDPLRSSASPATAPRDECQNTDRELWRERQGDFYADSIHVTEGGSIGINVGGTVYVLPVQEWHRLAAGRFTAPPAPAPGTTAEALGFRAASMAADPGWDIQPAMRDVLRECAAALRAIPAERGQADIRKEEMSK